MPLTTTNSEEIIEKKDSSPVATSCLLIAAVALVGAIVLQLAQYVEQTQDLSERQLKSLGKNRYMRIVKRDLEKNVAAVDEILQTVQVPEEDLKTYEDALKSVKGAPGTKWLEAGSGK